MLGCVKGLLATDRTNAWVYILPSFAADLPSQYKVTIGTIKNVDYVINSVINNGSNEKGVGTW